MESLKGLLAATVGHDVNTLKNLPKIIVYLARGKWKFNRYHHALAGEYDQKNNKPPILSIPRDTFIGVNKANAGGFGKISAIYQAGGTKRFKKNLWELTGLKILNTI